MKLFIAILVLLASVTAYAYTANDSLKTISTDGSYSDTTNACQYVQVKNQDGWVMTVGSPGGSYTWTNYIDFPQGHSFTFQGAATNNRPTITSTIDGYRIYVHATDAKLVTIRDLIFAPWTGSENNALFGVFGAGSDTFRFTNCKFNHANGDGATWAIEVSQPSMASGEGPYGLIDHCEFSAGTGYSGGAILVHDNENWNNPMSWGTKKAVYIEDCNFHAEHIDVGAPAMDGFEGCRIVFRYNVLSNYSTAVHGAEPYGDINNEGLQSTNGALQVEWMHNYITISQGNGSAWNLLMRGGSLTCFSNTVESTGNGFYNNNVFMDYYRNSGGGGPGLIIDRTNAATQYVGTQQPGCGVVASAGQDPLYPSNKWGSVPVYYWGNTINAPMNVGEINSGTAFVQLNRDYFNGTPRPGYTEYTYPHPLNTGGGGGGVGTSPQHLRVRKP